MQFRFEIRFADYQRFVSDLDPTFEVIMDPEPNLKLLSDQTSFQIRIQLRILSDPAQAVNKISFLHKILHFDR